MDTNQENQLQVTVKKHNNIAVKFANLFFVISTICLILTGLVAFSFLGLIIYYLLVICFLIITLFSTYKQVGELLSKGKVIQDFISFGFIYLPYVITAGVLSAIIALVLYISNKTYANRKSKIITSIVILIVYALAAILRFVVFAEN